MAKRRGHEQGEVNPAATWNPSDGSGLMAVPETVAARPAAAIEPFFRAEYSRVWRWVQRMGVPAAEADDVAQEVFLTAFRRPPETLSRAWIYQVTRRVCSHYRRGRGRAAERSRGIVWAPSPSTSPDQDLALARRQRAERFAAFLEQLPEEAREPFELVVLEGLSATEVAKLLGESRNTIYSRLRRTRERLNRWLEEEND